MCNTVNYVVKPSVGNQRNGLLEACPELSRDIYNSKTEVERKKDVLNGLISKSQSNFKENA